MGFTAGPQQSVENPLGVGEFRFHEWLLPLAGGANVAQQYFNAGLIDEMVIHLVPTLLGAGERLFDGVQDLHGLELVRTVAMVKVTHLKFARR